MKKGSDTKDAAIQPERRRGRSPSVLRGVMLELECQWQHEQRHYHQTVAQLRQTRALMEQRLSSARERRRAEERLRDEYHDSRATTIRAGIRV